MSDADHNEVERASVEEEQAIGSGAEEEILDEEAGILEEGDEAGEEAAEEHAGTSNATAGSAMDTNNFIELKLPAEVYTASQQAWTTFINSASSREAAGEAIYAALFDSAPSLQSLFVTPRAVQAMRFMNGLNTFITDLGDPAALKMDVETLGFTHLDKEVTVPRAVIFRDAIIDLFVVELGNKLTPEAANGFTSLLNYVGGALIFIRTNYAERLQLLDESWKIANDKGSNADKFGSSSMEAKANEHDKDPKAKGKEGDGEEGDKKSDMLLQNVPTTYSEMFQFNAAVMGFGRSMWMNEVLAVFDNIVSNVTNSQRVQEECALLVLRIAKVATGKVNLAEYKSCMLASLRSLLPKDWTTAHEVAWSWLWENVERQLMLNMGKTQAWEKALGKFIESIDEATGYQMRQDIYASFFQMSPAGEGYFKQSNTYLHIIATKVIVMSIDVYRDPVRMVDEISALGLRHVGYAIPTELFAPFVSACVQVVQGMGAEDLAVESFRWSLALVAQMLTRTIIEGSTIVMKAINTNSLKALNKAIGVAPRGERTEWVLVIKVGTQDISPLYWAISSGALVAADAMLKDMLTFRADRDKYYFAADQLFKRHPDIVQILLNDAPALLPQLLSGLIWRARITVNGMRRVNYYLKHLLVSQEGTFAKAIEWACRSMDSKLVCHPVYVLLADIVWTKVACRAFVVKKSWFLFTLLLYIVVQSILKNVRDAETDPDNIQTLAYITFACRMFIYCFSMGGMLIIHIIRAVKAYSNKDTAKLFGCCPVPRYFKENWQDVGTLLLTISLAAMLSTCPLAYCLLGQNANLEDTCPEAEPVIKPYSVFSMIAMILYYVLLMDLAVFNNYLSAYVLVCGRMIGELLLCLFALFGVCLTLSSALSTLDQNQAAFKDIYHGVQALWEMIIGIFTPEDFEALHAEPVLLILCYLFLIIAVIFLLNLLVAQLSCAYDAIYADMVGFARLKRLRIIVDTMPSVGKKRWTQFVADLALDKRLEFNEGDVGLPGGVQVVEPASANPTTVDMIKRFGGSTHPSNKWPEETSDDDDTDKFERMEVLLKKILDAVSTKSSSKHRGKGASSSGVSGSGGQAGTGSGENGEGGGSGEVEGDSDEVEADADS